VVLVALTLAGADLVWKVVEPTEPWAYHERSLAWLALSVLLLAGMAFVTRVPSSWVPWAAGVLAGGVLGNALSAAWNGLAVPNPIVIAGERSVIAFNFADVCALTGIVLLIAAVGAWLVRNRELLPTPAEARERWGRALRRRP